MDLRNDKNPVQLEALENQLEHLKGRLTLPGANQWRQLGKMAQDFTVWLERARPWMACAAPLIILRVEQIMEELIPERSSEKVLKKFSDLLEEAGRHLATPGLPIQVVDLEEESSTPEGDLGPQRHISLPSSWVKVSFPEGLVAVPAGLHHAVLSPLAFHYVIPN